MFGDIVKALLLVITFVIGHVFYYLYNGIMKMYIWFHKISLHNSYEDNEMDEIVIV